MSLRLFLRRASTEAAAGAPKVNMFGEVAPAAGKGRAMQDWEPAWFGLLGGALVVGGGLAMLAPDTDIRSWAKQVRENEASK